jgi:glutathione-specific gamma-glutamylcyclotransferase
VHPPLKAAFLTFAPMESSEHADADLWVFGYGSLMWRPGFAHLERAPARLIGLHRSLCVYSFVHRGTPEKPGLVLGLDRGGACRGIAYRIDHSLRGKTIAYLRAREQVTMVYRETWRDVLVAGDPERRVRALVYVVDRGHPQYAGRLDLEQQLHFVRQGHGNSGANRDYVLATVAEIEAQGIRDTDLHLLAERLKGGHETRHGQIATPLKP